MSRSAPHNAVDPATFVEFVALRDLVWTTGSPRRARRFINRRPVAADDARRLRRWRSGQLPWISMRAASEFLDRYDLLFAELECWALAEGRRVYINQGST